MRDKSSSCLTAEKLKKSGTEKKISRKFHKFPKLKTFNKIKNKKTWICTYFNGRMTKIFLITMTYVDKSHNRSVLSHEPDKANCPSEDITTSETKCPWPRKALSAFPPSCTWGCKGSSVDLSGIDIASSASSFHTIIVLSKLWSRI